MNDYIGLIKIINCRHFELLPMHPAHYPIEAFGKHPHKCQMNVWVGSDYAKQKCSSVSLWFDIIWQYTCQNICDSFFLNRTCFNVVFFSFCLQWTPTVIYLFLVWVINWQPVWLEYCWHAVNLDKQTLDTGVLRKKNYSLFLECTFDMNNC